MHGLILEVSVCHNVKVALESLGDHTSASTWGTHCSYEDDIFNSLPRTLFILAVVPTSVVHPLSQKFERGLSTVVFLLWHIQIINENDELLANRGSIHSLSSLFELIIKIVLSLICRGLSRECNSQSLIFFGKLVCQ